jgi:hypothetical protein
MEVPLIRPIAVIISFSFSAFGTAVSITANVGIARTIAIA